MRTGDPCPSNPISELVGRSKDSAAAGGCLNYKGCGKHKGLVALALNGSGYGVCTCVGNVVTGVLYGNALGKSAGDCKAVIYALLIGVCAVCKGDAGDLCLGNLNGRLKSKGLVVLTGKGKGYLVVANLGLAVARILCGNTLGKGTNVCNALCGAIVGEGRTLKGDTGDGRLVNLKICGKGKSLVSLARKNSGYGVVAGIGLAVAVVLYGNTLGKSAGNCKRLLGAIVGDYLCLNFIIYLIYVIINVGDNMSNEDMFIDLVLALVLIIKYILSLLLIIGSNTQQQFILLNKGMLNIMRGKLA